MADEARAFTVACETITSRTDLNPAVVRGTVRLALREAGLFDSQVSAAEMRVVARSLLAGELTSGGVPDAEAVCESVCAQLASIHDIARDDSPEAVFARLGVA